MSVRDRMVIAMAMEALQIDDSAGDDPGEDVSKLYCWGRSQDGQAGTCNPGLSS